MESGIEGGTEMNTRRRHVVTTGSSYAGTNGKVDLKSKDEAALAEPAEARSESRITIE